MVDHIANYFNDKSKLFLAHTKRIRPRRVRLLLLRMAHHNRGVDVEDQARYWPVRGHRDRKPAPSLVALRPRHLAGGRPRRPQPHQRLLVDAVQHPPRGRVRGHQAEKLSLAAQHRQIRDRLTPVSDHHRQVHRHPARVMTAIALPQPGQRLAELAG
jgi:hypothetical protein